MGGDAKKQSADTSTTDKNKTFSIQGQIKDNYPPSTLEIDVNANIDNILENNGFNSFNNVNNIYKINITTENDTDNLLKILDKDKALNYFT